MQYLYNDGELYYFMDNESFEQLPLNKEKVEDAMNFVKENMTVTIKFFKGEAFSVEPPNFVELLISETEPGFKGDTATSGSKPAILETGYKINVPLFINEGDLIRVDTRTGEYMERA
jgi:elongation factor P